MNETDIKRIADELVDNYLAVFLSGAVEEGTVRRDAIFTEVGDCSRCWRDIAWELTRRIAELH